MLARSCSAPLIALRSLFHRVKSAAIGVKAVVSGCVSRVRLASSSRRRGVQQV